MSVLAIDSSRRGRLVCLLAGESGALLQGGPAAATTTTAELPRQLTGLLDAAPSATVVVNGPGSYTGVRAGLAAALGLRAARGLPIHVLGSLELVAALAAGSGPLRVVADAGRGGLYTATYLRTAAALSEQEPPQRLAAGALPADGLPRFGLDPLELPGLTVLDPAQALAAGVPVALARPPLDPGDLQVVYIGAPGGVATPRV